MKTEISKFKIDEHKGWRAYWWDGYETKEQSICVMEFDPGFTFKHIHLKAKEFETEIVLEGKAIYSGDIAGEFGVGDIVEQSGKSKLIKIYNPGPGKLRLLVINRPPWRGSHETILTD